MELYLFLALIIAILGLIALPILLVIFNEREKKEYRDRLMSQNLDQFKYYSEILPQAEEKEKEAEKEREQMRKSLPKEDRARFDKAVEF